MNRDQVYEVRAMLRELVRQLESDLDLPSHIKEPPDYAILDICKLLDKLIVAITPLLWASKWPCVYREDESSSNNFTQCCLHSKGLGNDCRELRNHGECPLDEPANYNLSHLTQES